MIPRLKAALLKWLKPISMQRAFLSLSQNLPAQSEPHAPALRLVPGGKSQRPPKSAAQATGLAFGLKRYHEAMRLSKASQLPKGVMMNIVNKDGVTLPDLSEHPEQPTSAPSARSPDPGGKFDSPWSHLARKVPR